MSRASIGLGLQLPSDVLGSANHSEDDRVHIPHTFRTAPISSGSRPRGMDTQPKPMLGLGLDVTFPSNSSQYLAVPSTLPLLTPPLASTPSFHSRGPRSLGIRKGFVSSPPATLPPTRYTRDPVTNPLSPANPLNLLHLDTFKVRKTPAKHLRQLKRRSLANRSLSGTAIEPLGDAGLGLLSPDHGLSPIVGENSSPTMASSPTLGASSPVMSSIPVEHHENMLATAIALSVVLGLLVLGVSTWAGVAYRRRSQRTISTTDQLDEGEKSPKQSFSSIETFSASNVVEKGLKPRHSTSSETSATHTSVALRPTSILSTQILWKDQDNQRRVSFIDSPTSDTLALLEHRLYAPAGESLPSLRDSMLSTFTTLSATDRPSSSLRDSYGLFMYELDRIDEESSIRSAPTSESVHGQHTSEPAAMTETSQPDATDRPDSVTSTDSSSGETTYTTASARSSISDMTTMSSLSALSSAFPETPRGSEFSSVIPPLQFMPIEVETPSKPMADRKQRARSQTLVNVKHADLIRTAVGRTMSLQPTKQVMTALQRLAEQEGIKAFGVLKVELAGKSMLVPGDRDLGSVGAHCFHDGGGKAGHSGAGDRNPEMPESIEGDPTDFDPTLTPRPENGMKKVLFLLDASTVSTSLAHSRENDPFHSHNSSEGTARVTRSASFPSNLLSRRKSLSADPSVSSQRSEVLTGGYFKRALRAFRGEEVSLQGPTSIPPLPLLPGLADVGAPMATVANRPMSAQSHPDGLDMDDSADTNARLRHFFAELAARQGRDRDSLSSATSDHSEGEDNSAVDYPRWPGVEFASTPSPLDLDQDPTAERDLAPEHRLAEEEEPFEYSSSNIPGVEVGEGWTPSNVADLNSDVNADVEFHSDFDAYYLGLIEELDGQISFGASEDEEDDLERGGHVPRIRVTSH